MLGNFGVFVKANGRFQNKSVDSFLDGLEISALIGYLSEGNKFRDDAVIVLERKLKVANSDNLAVFFGCVSPELLESIVVSDEQLLDALLKNPNVSGDHVLALLYSGKDATLNETVKQKIVGIIEPPGSSPRATADNPCDYSLLIKLLNSPKFNSEKIPVFVDQIGDMILADRYFNNKESYERLSSMGGGSAEILKNTVTFLLNDSVFVMLAAYDGAPIPKRLREIAQDNRMPSAAREKWRMAIESPEDLLVADRSSPVFRRK